MQIKSLKAKILTSSLLVLIIIFSITIGIIVSSTKNMAVDKSIDLSMSESRRYAKIIENKLEPGFNILRVINSKKDSPRNIPNEDPNLIKDILERDLFNNMWISLSDEDFNKRYHVENGQLIENDITYDYIRKNKFKSETVLEPYTNIQNMKVSALVVPIKKDGITIGNLGITINFSELQNIINGFDIFETGFGRLLSNKGVVVAHPDSDRLWDESGDFKGDNEDKYRAVVANGQLFHDDAYSVSLGQSVFKSFAPVKIGNTETPWSFGIVVPHNEMFAEVSNMTTKVIIISVVAFIILAILIVLSVDKFVDTIIKIEEYALSMANGNFNLEIDNDLVNKEDELGKLAFAFKEIKDNLKDLIEPIMELTQDLSAYSEELSASAEEGNATIDTTQDLIRNISASIQEISASAQEVSSFAEETSQKTEVGSKNIDNTLNSINEINNSTNKALKIINDLDETAIEIENIISLITNISEQTNLLALNASIEAARAGEAGEGFAVVADEIRELAEETNEATDNIKNLIDRTQNKADNGLEAIKEVSKKAKEGKEVAQETEIVFNEIKEASEQTAEQIDQTANATQELTEQSEGMNSSTADIKNMSDEIANSSQELAEMSQELQSLIEEFKV
ncbi:methyl-accepting chemotaxis protein [Halanaerobacter jeridensis]|uniref:Methyl-accepting chemotaxis protein n=1 Tax=Halanaerobacter jeridensis TaxID=706427 RepID=A0A938XS81_9FIRM|nr:methyl-accepting chemotaxis protein [Halanaerobacter jeridensis]